MMEKSFDPAATEARWYRVWEDNGWFAPAAEGQPYCIMLPPPNVTGRLHMGHAFQHTIMDALTRYHRMQGDRSLWQCGTDHAGIATQMVVERQLDADGKSRHDLGRDAFVDAVWDWRHHSGGMITRQMRRLGDSVDWEHERFTMDDGLSAAVRKVFIDLYEQGLIYRGKRLVNWDPVLHTALSDLEVLSEEEKGSLWHIRYPRDDGKGHIVVATTRPETMLGDTAVAVHPEDERYADLVGKTVTLPLVDRSIPVIADDYVDPEFGTGCVKITPAHDFNDYEMGVRHGLEVINILTVDAAINDEAPEAYRGMDRYDARQQIVADLEAQDLMEAIEDHRLMVPRGDRSGAVVEPYLTDQWYVDLTRETLDDGRPGGKQAITDPAINAVKSGNIEFVPGNWDKTYYEWMYNIQDWCISRQLWWGHRIPAWYDEDGGVYVGQSEEDVRQRFELGDRPLSQDEDVLDTWFSSALWPFSTLGWPEQTERLQSFYPTSVLVTGFDIIFFWVARMIMMGMKFMGDIPFRQIYITGLIRDHEGQKMSKSKGNILDPLDLIDGIELDDLVAKRTTGLMQPHMAPKIEQATRKEFPKGIKAYGTDSLRFTFAALASTSRDISFDVGRIEGYRNFCNKLWNAARYVLLNTEDQPHRDDPDNRSVFDRWIVSRLNQTVAKVHDHFDCYRFDLAASAIYDFTWREYCDWYLELTKPVMQSGTPEQQQATRHNLLQVLETLLRLLHPITPFITEEIWQRVSPVLGIRGEAELTSISLQGYPMARDELNDSPAEREVEWMQSVLLGIRQIRGELDISPGKPLDMVLEGGGEMDRQMMAAHQRELSALGRVQSVAWLKSGDQPPESAVALAGELTIHIPLAGLINIEEELARLNRELDKRRGEIQRAQGKLDNPRFVENAPAAVVDKERDKLAAAEAAEAELVKQIQRLGAD